MGINPLGMVGGLVGGILGGGDEGGGPGGLLGGVLGGGEGGAGGLLGGILGGGGGGGLLGGLLGGGDPLSGLIGAAGDMLGLPKELTGALKVGAGLFTGDVMSVVSGGVELAGSLAHDLSSQTRSSFDRPESAVSGYAHTTHFGPPTRHHTARPVSRPAPRPGGSDVHITIDYHSSGAGLDRCAFPGVVHPPHSRPTPPPGQHVPGQAPHHAPRTDGTSSTEAAGGSSGAKEEYETLKTLEENFDQIDMRYLGPLFGHDGHIDMDDLQHLSASPNCPPDVKRAVRSLMENPELYQKLAQSGGAITRADIQMAMDDAQAEIGSAGGTSGGGEVSHAGDAEESGSTQEASGADESSGSDGASGSGGVGGQITDILNNPNLNIEEKIEQVLMLLENQVDGEIQDTMNDMAANESKSKKGKDASQADGEKSANTQQQLQMKLQQLMERRKALFDLMSNIDSKFNEMSSVAIQNLGKA